jgi:hypothetical protein
MIIRKLFTIANPEKKQPQVWRKYYCMPSRYTEVAKSIDTMVCTESTRRC